MKEFVEAVLGADSYGCEDPMVSNRYSSVSGRVKGSVRKKRGNEVFQM
jgi:hypothetical protein